MAKFSVARERKAAFTLNANDGDVAGTAVDLQGSQDCLLVASVGNTDTGLDASKSISLKVSHADSAAGPFEDVAESDLVGGDGIHVVVIDSDDKKRKAYQASYIGAKRFVRVDRNETGVVNALPVTVVASLGHLDTAPAE